MNSDFPPKHLGTVLALWHVFHAGFVTNAEGVNEVGQFTPQQLQAALLEKDPLVQSDLLVAIHVTMIKLISRSTTGANTVTWRATLARILSYGGGSRVRNRLRALQDKYERLPAKLLEDLPPALANAAAEEDAELEVGAILGAIATHPLFSAQAKLDLCACVQSDTDILGDAQAMLAGYGKSALDTMDALLKLAKLRDRVLRHKPTQQQQQEEEGGPGTSLGQISTSAAAQEEEEPQPPPPKKMHHMQRRQLELQALAQQNANPDQEISHERTVEEAERICQNLLQFETTEYTTLPLETKCFVLDYLIECFMESKHVHDMIEAALEETAQLEAVLEELESAQAELEFASQPKQVEYILNALRRRMRLDVLREIKAQEWQAKQSAQKVSEPWAQSSKARNEAMEEEDGAAAAEGEEEEEPMEEAEVVTKATPRGRKLRPETYIGKVINRTMYNISARAEVVSFDEEREMFRIEYLDDEPGLFEYLVVADVRKPVYKKCSDEAFIIHHVSNFHLESLDQDQLDLLRDHFERLGSRKDRQAAVLRLEEVESASKQAAALDLVAPMPCVCKGFGQGFILDDKAADGSLVHIQFAWGGVGSMNRDLVSVLREPVPSRQAFLDETLAKSTEIAQCKERLAWLAHVLRLPPVGVLGKDEAHARVYAMPNSTEYVLLCPDAERDDAGEVRRSIGNGSKINFANPWANLPAKPFELPLWLLPEAMQQKVLCGELSKHEASQPNTPLYLLLARLESDFRPWLGTWLHSSTPMPVGEERTLKAGQHRLLALERALMAGLASLAILQSFKATPQQQQQEQEEDSADASSAARNAANKEALELLQASSSSSDAGVVPDRPPFTLKNKSRFRKATGFREITGSFASVDEAWAHAKAELIQSLIWDDVSSAQLIYTALDAFWEQEVCVKHRAVSEARSGLNKVHTSETKQYALDGALASCSDGALMFLLRWLGPRKAWRKRIESHTTSFSELMSSAVQLERASYELRRAGATYDIPRDQVLRNKSRACYFLSKHREEAANAKQQVFLPTITPPLLELEGTTEPQILRIRRVELHADVYYLAFQPLAPLEEEEEEDAGAAGGGEDEEEQEEQEEQEVSLPKRKRVQIITHYDSNSSSDSEDERSARASRRRRMDDSEVEDSSDSSEDEEERRKRTQIEIAEDGRETSVHTRRPWYHYKIKPRMRLNTPCTVEGCEKNAIESNMGFCEDHREVKKRGRPIGSTSAKKKRPSVVKRVEHYEEAMNGGSAQPQPQQPLQQQQPPRTPAVIIEEAPSAAVAAAAASPDTTEDRCYVCLMGGDLVCCDAPSKCIKVYHQTCLLSPPPLPTTTSTTAPSEDVPWVCPLHMHAPDTREFKLETALLHILDAVARLDNAELIAGNAEDHTRDELADNLISIRRKLILHHGYASFDEMHQDCNRLRKRYMLEAHETNNTALELAVDRLCKNFKVRISRAKAAMDGGNATPATASVREPFRAAVTTGGIVLRSTYAQQHQASFSHQYDEQDASRHFFDGEHVRAGDFMEQVDPSRHIAPGKVLFNISHAIEASKTFHWPVTGARDQRLERIATINASGRRLKMDDFASTEDFILYQGELLLIVRRGCGYLQTEKSWKRAQTESQMQQYVAAYRAASEAYSAVLREFEHWKHEALKAWYLMCHSRQCWSEEQVQFMNTAVRAFAALALRLGIPSKPSTQSFFEPDDAPPAIAVQQQTAAGAAAAAALQDAMPSLEHEYAKLAALGEGNTTAYFNTRRSAGSVEDEQVLRVVDDACFAVSNTLRAQSTLLALAAAHAPPVLSPLVVNLVCNQRRLARPSNQRLVAMLHLKRNASANQAGAAARGEDEWYAGVRMGDLVYCKLNPQTDLFGWPAIVVNARLNAAAGDGQEVFVDLEFVHDAERRRFVHLPASHCLVLNSHHGKPDVALREGMQVGVAVNSAGGGMELKLGRVAKPLECDGPDQVRVHFLPPPGVATAAPAAPAQGEVFNVKQVRSLHWMVAATEAGKAAIQQRNNGNNRRGLDLLAKQRAPSKRDTQMLVNVRIKRGSGAGVELAQLPATFPSTGAYDSDLFDIGDYVDVCLLQPHPQQQQHQQQQVWKLAQVLARVGPNLLQLKTLRDGNVFQIDKRLVRRPQRKYF